MAMPSAYELVAQSRNYRSKGPTLEHATGGFKCSRDYMTTGTVAGDMALVAKHPSWTHVQYVGPRLHIGLPLTPGSSKTSSIPLMSSKTTRFDTGPAPAPAPRPRFRTPSPLPPSSLPLSSYPPPLNLTYDEIDFLEKMEEEMNLQMLGEELNDLERYAHGLDARDPAEI